MDSIKIKLNFIKYCLMGIINDINILNDIYEHNKYPSEEIMQKLLNSSHIPTLRIDGRDQPNNAYTMIGVKRMDNLHDMLDYIRINNINGDLVETGVWKGGATIFMKIYCDVYGLDKKIFVCDSFEGLPKPSGKFKEDIGDLHHTYENLKVSLDSVKFNFKKFHCLDEKVIFVKGFFSDTLPNNDNFKNISLLRMDGDMYESTHDVFYSLYDKLVNKGVLIVDDYCLNGAKTCVEDFRKLRNITENINTIDICGVYWIKK